jgi:hypothetical protein
MSLTLTVSHNIFLDRNQRYSLFNGNAIEVTGVSIPVWYYQGITSEPANEIFCTYKLIPDDNKIHINYNKSGYEMFLPLSAYQPEGDNSSPISLKNILDLKDGGIAWLAFRQFGKAKKNNRTINIVHFVEIKTIEELDSSIV